MSDRIGWIIHESKAGWTLSYSATGGIYIAGFETRHEAAQWLLAFFDQNANRELLFAERERRRQAKAQVKRDAVMAALLEPPKGKPN